MARPRHTIRRDRQFNISLTEAEHKMLVARAEALRMRPVDFGREQLFKARRGAGAALKADRPHLDPLFHAALSRLGNNLNQIARCLHAQQEPVPPALQPLLIEIRILIAKGTERGP